MSHQIHFSSSRFETVKVKATHKLLSLPVERVDGTLSMAPIFYLMSYLTHIILFNKIIIFSDVFLNIRSSNNNKICRKNATPILKLVRNSALQKKTSVKITESLKIP